MHRPSGVPAESRFVDWARGLAPLVSLYRRLPFAWRDAVSQLSNRRLQRRLTFRRTPAWVVKTPLPTQRVPLSATSPSRAGERLGVNVFGYLRGEFGLGESARQYARALMAAGVDVALVDMDLGLPHGWKDDSLGALLGTSAPFAVNLVFVNPDYLDAALEQIGKERLAGKHLIACWFWELDKVPDAWISSLDSVDELLVSSGFVEECFRRVTDKPILRAPLPLAHLPDSGLQRVDFGLPEEEFVFLASFDFNSWVARKNPYAVVAAFLQAFPLGNERVVLLLKTSNGFRYPTQLRALLVATSVDHRIVVRDDIIERAHMTALHRCCDAYVSLHRAEGFGLGLAEAMALGKPVIATNWSGNLDFMSSDVACMVDYRRVAVKPEEYPHSEGATWAEPDVASAADAMRRLAADPAAAARLGVRAREHVVDVLAPEKAASAIVRRLQSLGDVDPNGDEH
ncbi:glycosyltransferase family 4 protein [Pseudoxanthomonas sp. PXM01]|nr:glycosyltransferase family 4 protein [Pseudoxanthomonas sp. PXM01]